MKKTYIIPATKVEHTVAAQMIAASITHVSGESNLGLSDGEAPSNADVKGSVFEENAFDVEW